MVIHTGTWLLNSQEAAKRLGVTVNRVQALIRNGQLKTIPVDSRHSMITLQSVQHMRLYQGKGGRPYSPDMAMGMLYLLNERPVEWLSIKQRYKARQRLLDIEAEAMIRKLRNRALVKDYWAIDANVQRIRTAIRESGSCADIRDKLELLPTEYPEGYVTAKELAQIVTMYRLKETSTEKKIRLHIFEELPPNSAPMPVSVCAADLAESSDIREQTAGIAYLRELLARYQKEHDE